MLTAANVPSSDKIKETHPGLRSFTFVLFVTLLMLAIPERSFALPTLGPGVSAGGIGDAGAEWTPTVGLNLDVGPAFNVRHLVSGIKRGAYNIYGSHTHANYNFPISSNLKALRFRLGAGYMRKVVSVQDSEMRANNEPARKYATGYVFLSHGVSARANFGILYTALDLDGFIFPNVLLPFYRGYGLQFSAVVTVGVEL